MKLLPKASEVVIPESKLKYSMEQSESKKRLWNSILGFTYDADSECVRKQIKDGVLKYGCMHDRVDKYGNHYYVVVLMVSHKGTEHKIFTAWVEDKQNGETRLTTLYPLKQTSKKEVIML